MNTGAVNFHGITKSPPEGAPLYGVRPEISGIPKDSLFLVFEYATEGSLSVYLISKLDGSNEDWKVILDVLEQIANGLHTFQKLGIVHR